MSAKNVHDFEGIEPRTVRAAREAMAVDAYAHGEGTGMFDVYSASSNTYTVSLRDPLGCTCPDFQQRGDQLGDAGCKHIRRVRLALGIDPIPEILENEVDGTLAANREKFTPDTESEDVEPEPEPVDAKPEGAVQVATDGGVVLEEPDTDTDTDADADEDDESESGRPVDRDIRLEANRIATEAVAESDGPLADFDVFCVTVEATQDTILRSLKEV
jgi:predicted nucleic acid-binding Zn finger protein